MKALYTSKSNCLTKIFLILTMALLLSIGSGAKAFASEATVSETVTGSQDVVSEEASTDNETIDQGVVLGEGYYVDEQGQIYYDESMIKVDEPVIEDITEEDTEEVAADNTTKQDEAKAEDKKDTKDQTKDKTTEVKKPTYSESDLRLLSSLIYAEAGNQSYKGMLAVANVVINRSKSDIFWHVNTIKEVVYDRKWSVQFSVTIKSSKTGLSSLDKALKLYDTGKFTGANPEAEKKAMTRAIKAAKDALEGKNNIGNYLCFTNKNGTGSIKKKYPDYKIIGDHIFYRTK